MRRPLLVPNFTIFTILFMEQAFAHQESVKHLSYFCFHKCVASCLQEFFNFGDEELLNCSTRCEPYDSPDLCPRKNHTCWQQCRNLQSPNPGDQNTLDDVVNVTYGYEKNYKLFVRWNPVPHADIYVVNYWPVHSMFQRSKIITTTPQLHNFSATTNICQKVEIQITPVSVSKNLGDLPPIFLIPPPKPKVNPRLQLVSMNFINKTFTHNGYESNATVRIIFRYEETKWPLGGHDLELTPIFHITNCDVATIGQVVPEPNYVQGLEERTIQMDIGADVMYRRCAFVYAAWQVYSFSCALVYNIKARAHAYQSIKIDCKSVNGSVCVENSIYRAPLCGTIYDFKYDIVNKDNIDWNDPHANISVDISFVPFLMRSLPNPLYYVAFYGNAQPYEFDLERMLLGVNLISIDGRATNCVNLLPNNTCANVSTDPIRLTNLRKNNLYGVITCGVIDPRNTTFPFQKGKKWTTRYTVNQIFIDSEEFLLNHSTKPNYNICRGRITIFLFSFFLLCFFVY